MKDKEIAKKVRFEQSHERLKKKYAAKDDSKNNLTVAPLLNATDVEFLASTRYKMSQRDILKKHVKNHTELNLKQRREVMGHIQAQRAMHAKEIFLKELSAIGSQRKAR
jgi:hypothetical protein